MRARPYSLFLAAALLSACTREASNSTGEQAVEQGAVATNGGNKAAPTEQPEPAGEIGLSVSPEETTQDSTVTLALRNGSRQQIGYNLCTSALQTAEGRDVPTSRACTMELRTLDPGRTDTYRFALPVNMAEGRYRFSAQVERMPDGGMRSVRSNSFNVRSD